MNKLIEKLEKLDKDATAGNWYYHAPKVTAYGTKHDLGISGPMEDGKRKIIAETVGQVEPINKMVNSLANAILITQTRNALPEIIQALKQGEKMREALQSIESKGGYTLLSDCCVDKTRKPAFDHNGEQVSFCTHRYGVSRGYSECADEARQTLSECEEKEK